jgi:hypothetical protein
MITRIHELQNDVDTGLIVYGKQLLQALSMDPALVSIVIL